MKRDIVGQAAVDRKLLEAVEHYDAGRAEQAGALCADILDLHPDHVPALHLSAVIAFVSDRAAEGAKLLARVFSLAPDHAPALATLGDALAVKGEQEGAATAFERAVLLQPQDAGLHAKLGASLCDLSRFEQAEGSLRRALALDPELTRARFNLAVALAGQTRFSEAEQAYRAVLARDPHYRGAWLNLGNVLSDQGKLEEAVDAYRRALSADPGDAGLERNLGAALYQQGRLEDAISHYRRAIELAPDDVDALRLLGLTLHEAGRLEEAAQVYRQTALDPGDHVILSNLAACLCELGELDEAMMAVELAIALKPDYAMAHTNRGIILEARGDIEAAVAAHRRAIEVDPAFAKGHANLAVSLRSAGELDEALRVSHLAITLDPDQPLARYNHAHFLLMNGDLKNGFEEFQWGRKCKLWSHHYPAFNQPEWQGEPLEGRTLLLFSEYGLGDALQLVRYLPMVMGIGGPVVLQVQPPLVPLLRDMRGVTVVSRGEALPPVDLQLPLMGLPRVFGTELDTIPAAVPYLHPDGERLAKWRQALGCSTSLRVGVVWAGNPLHKGDRQRSLPADELLPRLVTPGAQLFSLQKETRAADAPAMAALGADIIDLAPALGDFADTAAAVAALDLVIAVDTSVAHLAGALGRPVWLLLPYALDWRWLRDREDSPWYPTMRLFRQEKPRAWEGVIARASADLARVAAGERQLLWPPSSRS
ncbi:tetratricopeptide repeat protein [Bradyrhizobium sp. ARR65]|uniref:tetratricopeptide repeat protein n=1 Tax=Bradyrhizobium sp. ARR65 TaxID=1040989 RepID=UPI001FD9C45D|nr:tetratricopeptide repeat protein [Bradyrhizobium sp. ARR65]